MVVSCLVNVEVNFVGLGIVVSFVGFGVCWCCHLFRVFTNLGFVGWSRTLILVLLVWDVCDLALGVLGVFGFDLLLVLFTCC